MINVVEFVLEDQQTDGGYVFKAVNIKVNGMLLKDIIKKVELPWAKQEGNPSVAGAYGALEIPKNPEKYYMGLVEATEGENEDKTALLDCDCGCSGCWPLLCKIKIDADTVKWEEFEQPHRGRDEIAPSHWDYSGFDGFMFSKEQYLNALKSIIIDG